MIQIDFSASPDADLLIGSLVSSAAELYDSYGDCGARCNHPSGSCNDSFYRKQNCQNCGVNSSDSDVEEDCLGCCLECADEVHHHKSYRLAAYRPAYNCQKLAYYYTCRYSWKYCSEIMYAIEDINFTDYDRFRILSLGSGPAPDLMAFEQINRKYKKTLNYTGIDMNPYWKALYDKIKEYCNEVDIGVTFKNKDVFEALDDGLRPRTPYNVLVLQYLISSFPDQERAYMVDHLCDLLIKNVISKKEVGEPFLIVLNDIDHNTLARDHFSTIFDKLHRSGFQGTIQKAHFKARAWDFKDGSTQYPSSANKFIIPDGIINKFNCAVHCSSAQMILEVR